MESGEILDEQITASGSLNESGVHYGPELARPSSGKEVALGMLKFTSNIFVTKSFLSVLKYC